MARCENDDRVYEIGGRDEKESIGHGVNIE
jgi:hypothetical protein